MTETGSLSIRRAKVADGEAIRALTRAAYAKWVPVIGREPKPMTADYHAAVRNHIIDLMFVYEDLAALIETLPATDHLLIENVAVLPSYQGHGYGRALMDHAEKLSISLGLRETRLYTNKLFTENVRFYRRLGYQVDQEAAFSAGIVVHMSKRF